MIDTYQDYLEAGFKIFGLHTVKNGLCTCENPECQAPYKHPKVKRWQCTPDWSQEQLDCMEMKGDFDTGFGVLLDKWLVIDIDPRNGGAESYEKLCNDTGLDFKAESGFVVYTGGGGWHIYYTRPNGDALVSKLNHYPGIDFKSSGFVVGADSLHVSGNTYDIEKGAPCDVSDPPQTLIDLLKKKESHRATVNGSPVDVSESDIKDMLQFLDPDCSYDEWVKIGMSVHHATGGSGFNMWCDWSAKGSKYPGSDKLERHWHSFGKSANPATLGTLVYYAEQAGYKMPVTFQAVIPKDENLLSDCSEIDLNRPPGFVGRVAEWVRSNSDKRTDSLACASALAIVSNAASLTYTSDDLRPVYGNIFCFCVAGSGAGKQEMMNSVAKAMTAIGYIRATAGGNFKSEQAVVRSMLRNQLVIYLIDEIGLELTKVTGKNSADYMQGITKNLMSAFSASDGRFGVEQEVIEEALKKLNCEIAGQQKLIDENEGGSQDIIDSLCRVRDSLTHNNGIMYPFVSITGYTTPETFNHLVSGHNVKQGFFTRSLIFREKETVPDYDESFTGSTELPDDLKMILIGLAATGTSDDKRLENLAPRKKIPTADSAKKLLQEVKRTFHKQAKNAKSVGLESIYTRAFELTLKVSFVLSVAEGLRTIEHVKWAYALVDRDIKEKMNLAAANIAEEIEENDEALCRRILDQLDKKEGAQLTTGVIVNRCRNKKFKEPEIKKALEHLQKQGLIQGDCIKSKRGETMRWFKI